MVQSLTVVSFPIPARICEYNESEIEYWVNTRTSGTLSREELQKLSISRSHEGSADDGGFATPGELDDQCFPETLGEAPPELQVEGGSALQVTKPHQYINFN